MAKRLSIEAREAYWRDHIAALAQSELGLAAYCQGAGIGQSTLKRWMRIFRLREAAGSMASAGGASFIPVSMLGAGLDSAGVPRLEVRLHNGHVLRFEGAWPWAEVWSGVALLLR